MHDFKDEIIHGAQRKIRDEVRDYIERLDYGEAFTLGVMDLELQIRDKEHKAIRMQEVRSQVQNKHLRKHRGRAGHYKKLQPIDIIEWWKAPSDPLDLYLPFDLSDYTQSTYIRIFAGNMIACAGRQNAGKTSIAQEVIEQNIDRNLFPGKIRYLVNESGGPEIRYRLENNTCITPEKWKENVIVINRSADYADALDPDAFNVIDYLTDYEEAWSIGRQMSEVYEVIRNQPGVVWVNLQKDSDRDTGRGGSVTLDIPRLYLSMNETEVKIVKAKFAGKLNPNGQIRDFKISEEGNVIPTGTWHF